MPWIEVVPPEAAEGELKSQYDSALRRAGRVFHIVRLSSLNPEVNKLFLDLYLRLMHARSELTRREREMVATAVSAANSCHY